METVDKPKKLLGYYGRWDFESIKSCEYFITDIQGVADFIYACTDNPDLRNYVVRAKSVGYYIGETLHEARYKEPSEVKELVEKVVTNLGQENVVVHIGAVYFEKGCSDFDVHSFRT